ncbi:TspO/MBR family protein [Streptomyces sp. NPDC046716]|uniref:TspO/MBR family protein n=1 Tax=Streptomyces sp. NPDC046716 TaxID=3157093 RepID=UPI0033F5353C
MRLTRVLSSSASDRSKAGALRSYGPVGAAVVAAAALGSLAIDPRDSWYRSLEKPPWQPPPAAFGAVWTPLYISIAAAGGRTMQRAPAGERPRWGSALAVNLALNAAFGWSFFKARTPYAGLAVTAATALSSWDLVRRSARIDRGAAAALVPYATWCTFATALNAEIARRNT